MKNTSETTNLVVTKHKNLAQEFAKRKGWSKNEFIWLPLDSSSSQKVRGKHNAKLWVQSRLRPRTQKELDHLVEIKEVAESLDLKIENFKV